MIRKDEAWSAKALRIAVPFVLGVALWLLLFWVGSAVAQPAVVHGGALKKRQFQTYSAMNLYVNADGGSDSNACTAASSPCATIQAAVDRIPYWVRHDVTVNVEPIWVSDGGAPEYYAEDVTIAGHRLGEDGTLNATPPRIVLQGSSTWSTAAVTGGATGTVTSYTGASLGQTGILEDNTKTWTANAITQNNFFVTVNGVRSPIAGNDATQLANNRNLGTVNAGDAYAIEVPSTNIVGHIYVKNITGQASALRGGVLLSNLNVVQVSSNPTIDIQNVVQASEQYDDATFAGNTLFTGATVLMTGVRIISTVTGAAPTMRCSQASCGFRGPAAMTSGSSAGIEAVDSTLDLGMLRLISAHSAGSFGQGVLARRSNVFAAQGVSTIEYTLVGGFPVIEQVANTGYALYGSDARIRIPYIRVRAGSTATSAAYGARLDRSTWNGTNIYCDDVYDTTGYQPTTCLWLKQGSQARLNTLGGTATTLLTLTEQSAFQSAIAPSGGSSFELNIDGDTSLTFAGIDALTPRYVQGQKGSQYLRE